MTRKMFPFDDVIIFLSGFGVPHSARHPGLEQTTIALRDVLVHLYSIFNAVQQLAHTNG